VRGNNSGDNAGGIYNDQNAILTIYNSAIINNLADAAAPDIIEGGGGGVLNEINATLIMVNTTVSGNKSASGENQDGPGDGGGGILSRGTTRIINSTIVNNAAQVGSGIYSETTNADTILFNTIVGNNTGSPDLDGFFDDRSAYNLISNSNAQGILDDQNNNTVGGRTNPIIELNLGPLANNGGPTPTHALLQDSLAIDNGSNEFNNEFIEEIETYFPLNNLINGRATDQRFTEITTDTGIIKRGFERIAGGVNGVIDIGAFEFGAVEIEEFSENNSSNLNSSDNLDNNTNSTQNLELEINSPSNSHDSLLNTPLFRLQNSAVPGTYLYATEAEKTSILANYPNFINEGLAFKVGVTPDDDLIAFYRFQNRDIPGTYLYASEAERSTILANYANFKEEGLAFYAYDGNADLAQDVYRLQNRDQPGTYLFVGGQEKDQILANYDNYVLEGVAFEASLI
jgi:hypothetical protein